MRFIQEQLICILQFQIPGRSLSGTDQVADEDQMPAWLHLKLVSLQSNVSGKSRRTLHVKVDRGLLPHPIGSNPCTTDVLPDAVHV